MPKVINIFIASYFAFSISNVVAADKPAGVTDLTSKSIEIKKKDKNEQIDLRQKGKREGSVTILDEDGRRNVSMACITSDNGHRIMITVNNQNATERRCQSQCYYQTSSGNSGVHRCNGKVRGGFNGEFCSDFQSNLTFTITDPGAFDCQK